MYDNFEEMDFQDTILIIGLLLVIANHKVTNGCHGPGATMGVRRPGRSMTPLVYKQHIPNISEFTIGASGPTEGRISKEDKRYKDLAVNYNPLVVFKDEEGTEDDRRMTKRCKDRVDTLALLVGNQWPAVRLRVIEAWDQDQNQHMHTLGSLHYEGRAVDITTDDTDRSKYGLLARLAVEAGFDWVYYESKNHIHASVIAEDSETEIYGSGCFPADSTVVMEDGDLRKMSELNVGDRVLTSDRTTGASIYSDVILMMHSDENAIAYYMDISVTPHYEQHQKMVRITSSHLMFVHRHDSHKYARWRPRAIFASEVKLGDVIYINSGNNSQPLLATVTEINFKHRHGVYAPLTYEGTIVVDGVVTSCYAVYENEPISHALFLPLRTLWRWGIRWSSSFNGIHWYPKSIFHIASLVLPSGMLKP